MTSLRDYFILPQRAAETFHFQGYEIRLQKEQQTQAGNLHEKITTK